jgi:MFS family permease
VRRRRWFLDNRDFTLLWGGELLSEVGSQTATVAYPLLVLALTGSPSKAGIVGLAKWLPLAIFALPAGVVADRVDRKRLMIACDVTRMVGAASIVVLLIAGRPPYAQVLAVAFLDGAMFVTSYICERGALRQVVAPDQVQDAVARNEARTFAAGIVGPSLGGVLFSLARALPFIADVASYVCSTAAIAATRSRFQLQSTASKKSTLKAVAREAAEGFGWLRSQPFYLVTAVLFAFGNPVYTGLYLLAILLAKHDHASSGMVGAMLTVVGICGLLGAVLSGPIRRTVGARTILVGEVWAMLGLVLLLLVVREPLLIGLLIGAAEFFTPTSNAVVAGSRVAAAPDDLQGRVQSATTTLSMALAWLGPLAAGYLFQHTGTTTTVLIIAGWTLALALATTLAPSIRHHVPTRPAATTADD